jgi:hypothetical protein
MDDRPPDLLHTTGLNMHVVPRSNYLEGVYSKVEIITSHSGQVRNSALMNQRLKCIIDHHTPPRNRTTCFVFDLPPFFLFLHSFTS